MRCYCNTCRGLTSVAWTRHNRYTPARHVRATKDRARPRYYRDGAGNSFCHAHTVREWPSSPILVRSGCGPAVARRRDPESLSICSAWPDVGMEFALDVDRGDLRADPLDGNRDGANARSRSRSRAQRHRFQYSGYNGGRATRSPPPMCLAYSRFKALVNSRVDRRCCRWRGDDCDGATAFATRTSIGDTLGQ